jgi:hypothetical protein
MPLIMSPIDGSPMRQVKRYGIEIDVCPTSGGIWMDKGELEKLMAFLREEAINEQNNTPPAHSAQRHNNYRDDDEDGYGRNQENYGKKSKMSRVMDIFDF